MALTEALDESALIPDAYVLEVSSPGVSDILTSDRDFADWTQLIRRWMKIRARRKARSQSA